MIPRIVEPRSIRREKRLAFGRGDNARPLRIFIDSSAVSQSEALSILLGFAHHEQVEVISIRVLSSTRLGFAAMV
jgi:hypothetical protein